MLPEEFQIALAHMNQHIDQAIEYTDKPPKHGYKEEDIVDINEDIVDMLHDVRVVLNELVKLV